MKRQFVYELKRILLPLIVFTAVAAVVFVVAALSTELVREYSDGTLHAINPLTPVPASILGVLCYIVPVLQFSYRMKTRSADLWYSLPVKRGALLLQRLLAGLLLVFVPYAVSFAAGVAVIAFRDNLFVMGYYAGYFAALIPAGLALFGINCFLFTRASTIIDGIVFELGSMALLLMPFWWLDTLIPYYAPDALKGLQYHFLTDKPLDEIGSAFASAILGDGIGLEDISALTCAVAGVEGAAAYFGLFWTAARHKTETIEQPSDSPFGYRLMIPLYVFCFAAVFSANGLANAFDLITMPIIFTCGLAAYFFYRRSFRLRLSDWLWLAGSFAAGIAIGLLGYYYLQPWIGGFWPEPPQQQWPETIA